MYLCSAFIALSAIASQANALTLTGDEVWVISGSEPTPLASALVLVQKDAYLVLGIAPVILSAPPAAGSLPAGTVVVYVGSVDAAPWLSGFDLSGCVTGWESHCVKAFPPGAAGTAGYASIVATGEGMRGAMYGAFSFSEDVLGVNPWALFTDDPPAYVGSATLNDSLSLTWPSPQYRWRGLFINDEVSGAIALSRARDSNGSSDASGYGTALWVPLSLGKFASSAFDSKSPQDLLANHRPEPLGHAAIDLRMYDEYMTTVLRLKGNLIVPATNPLPDQDVYSLAAGTACSFSTRYLNW